MSKSLMKPVVTFKDLGVVDQERLKEKGEGATLVAEGTYLSPDGDLCQLFADLNGDGNRFHVR